MSEIIGSFGGGPREARVRGVREALVDAELDYKAKSPDRILDIDKLPAGVTTEVAADIRWAYDAKLGIRAGNARRYYDLLRSATRRCPLCMQREVAALDHYLPRDSFPALSITPVNLVPICNACNGIKLAFVAATADAAPLHPYFDQLPASSWLSATLQQTAGCPIRYGVRRQPGWDDITFRRVVNHFERLQLAELYSAEAATLLANHQLQLETIRLDAGPNAVRALLEEMASSYRAADTEPWSALAFSEWGESQWFCDGAWRL